MDEKIITQILKNQLVIIHALSALLTPHCKGIMDNHSETKRNAALIDRMHETEKLLGLGYGELPK